MVQDTVTEELLLRKPRFVYVVFGLACIGYILIDLAESGMTMICVIHEMGFS